MNAIDNQDSYSMESFFGQQPASSSFDIFEFFSKILKYWYLFLLCLAVASGLAYLKNKSWTPTYKSATTILIEENRASLKNDLMGGFASRSSGQQYFNNQMLMYRSRTFISKAVEQLNLTNEIYEKDPFKKTVLYKNAPVKIVSNYIAENAYNLEFKIRGIDNSRFEISFEGNDNTSPFKQTGEYGVPIQNTLFFAEITKTENFVQPQFNLHFHFFSQESLIAQYGSRLSSKVLMEGSSIIEIGITGKVAQRDLDFLHLLNEQFFQDNLDRKNETAERSISFIDRQIAIIKNAIDSSEMKLNSFQITSGIYSQDQSALRSKTLEDLDQKKNELRLRKEYLKYLSSYLQNQNKELLTDPAAFQIQNPQLSASITQYNLLALEMKTLGTGSPIYSKTLKAMEDIRSSIRETIKAINSIIALEERNITQRYEKAQADLANLPKQERELLTHERDFKLNDTYYMYLLQKRTESQIQKASNAPDNLVIDQPRIVGVINGAETHNTYILFLIIGLVIPLIYIACKEFIFKFKIQSKEEIEKTTKIPILSTINRTKSKALVPVLDNPQSSFAESFRNLRSRMEFMVQKELPVSMLVTSTEPQDGKTFISTNLAAIYRMGGKKVILVDCDLRRPALSKKLDVDNKSGLSNVLIGQAKLDDAISTLEWGCDVLPAGVIPPNPSELMHSPQMREILEELSERYDYVILDCSPVGLVSDALFLSRIVDIVLYVVRDEKTNKNFFRYTVKELKQDKIDNIALIYNDVDTKSKYGTSYGYGKNSYYSKYHKYYTGKE